MIDPCLFSKLAREGHEDEAKEDDGRAGCCRLTRHRSYSRFTLLEQCLIERDDPRLKRVMSN